jgi:hypothetical protein
MLVMQFCLYWGWVNVVVGFLGCFGSPEGVVVGWWGLLHISFGLIEV